MAACVAGHRPIPLTPPLRGEGEPGARQRFISSGKPGPHGKPTREPKTRSECLWSSSLLGEALGVRVVAKVLTRYTAKSRQLPHMPPCNHQPRHATLLKAATGESSPYTMRIVESRDGSVRFWDSQQICVTPHPGAPLLPLVPLSQRELGEGAASHPRCLLRHCRTRNVSRIIMGREPAARPHRWRRRT